MKKFKCPHLEAEIEMTVEREAHITERHPDLLPRYQDKLAETLLNPDVVRQSPRLSNALLFSRWFDDVREGKHVVVVVVSELGPKSRYWIVTAYMARQLIEGIIVWQRN